MQPVRHKTTPESYVLHTDVKNTKPLTHEHAVTQGDGKLTDFQYVWVTRIILSSAFTALKTKGYYRQFYKLK